MTRRVSSTDGTPGGDALLRARIRQRFAGTAPGNDSGEAWLAGLPPELTASFHHLMPAQPTRAAVLVPIVDRDEGLTVLLTQRAADLKHHPGQISFPGGRLEPDDEGAVAAALRETEEEIGLRRSFVEVVGYLPDHLIISGYRVTPVIGFVRPGFELELDTTEVSEAFEVPLQFLLDPAHHKARRRQLGEGEIEVYDIPYGERNIWGATAGMLMTLYRLLSE
ncbi:MAG TPA: CoA pyrophosphatase [Steroidobacteraceae bacterium]|nr:CoA pyrophosphatase [Steroidobacteraceae bacterium]